MPSSSKPTVLVLCTGNSARSQMTKAFIEKYKGDSLAVLSAGTEPAEEVHPLARQVLTEVGLDLGDVEPIHFKKYLGRAPVHTLIIVCDGAAKACPAIWPGAQQRLLWPFDDPASYDGSMTEKLAKFREVRDAIEAKVEESVDLLPG